MPNTATLDRNGSERRGRRRTIMCPSPKALDIELVNQFYYSKMYAVLEWAAGRNEKKVSTGRT